MDNSVVRAHSSSNAVDRFRIGGRPTVAGHHHVGSHGHADGIYRGLKVEENFKAFRHGESEFYDMYRRLLDRPSSFGDRFEKQFAKYAADTETLRRNVRNAETNGGIHPLFLCLRAPPPKSPRNTSKPSTTSTSSWVAGAVDNQGRERKED